MMAADKDGDKPLQQEIAAWMRNLREEWFAKLKCPQVPLRAGHRFVYAFFGSMTWVIATFPAALQNPDLTEVLAVFTASGGSNSSVLLIVGSLYSCWFAILIAYRKRESAPIRFFLDGILLPTAVVAIIQLSWPDPEPSTSTTPATAATMQENR